MISESQMQYGSRVRRHSRSRFAWLYQASNCRCTSGKSSHKIPSGRLLRVALQISSEISIVGAAEIAVQGAFIFAFCGFCDSFAIRDAASRQRFTFAFMA